MVVLTVGFVSHCTGLEVSDDVLLTVYNGLIYCIRQRMDAQAGVLDPSLEHDLLKSVMEEPELFQIPPATLAALTERSVDRLRLLEFGAMAVSHLQNYLTALEEKKTSMCDGA